jgi:hypothetical protein
MCLHPTLGSRSSPGDRESGPLPAPVVHDLGSAGAIVEGLVPQGPRCTRATPAEVARCLGLHGLELH